MPASLLLERFQERNPGAYCRPYYRTRDHIIPFGLFWLQLRRMPATRAHDRIDQTRAISHALALAFAKKDAPPSELTRNEFKEAFLDGGDT